MTGDNLENRHDIVLVLSAHPDDETIGLGGTIKLHAARGDKVFVAFFTDGESSRFDSDQSQHEIRRSSAVKASEILGFDIIEIAIFQDNHMDSSPLIAVVREIERIKTLINPTVVYTHWHNDLNIDHQVVAKATFTAFRPQPNESLVSLRQFEVPSATDYSWNPSFKPNFFVDIESVIAFKQEALAVYQKELRDYPHTRSMENILHLAALRGGQIGLSAAESFYLARHIEFI